MPANDFEIEASIHEGVEYHFLAAPTKIMADENNALRQIEYIKMELGEPDSSGRRSPVPIEGSEEVMDVDVVIAAIGQRPLDDFYTADLKEKGLKLTKWNSIEADPETLQTDVPHIFTCGDVWTGCNGHGHGHKRHLRGVRRLSRCICPNRQRTVTPA